MRMQACVVFALVGLAASTSGVFATGPDQQRLPWRPGLDGNGKYSRLNSVVQVSTNTGLGTGTVIGTRQVGNDHWLCVLTADHVVRGSNNIQVSFGDNGAIGTFGGADSWHIQRGQDDMAVVAVRLNAAPAGLPGVTAAQFAGRLNFPSFISGLNSPSDVFGETFTQAGYGGYGNWDTRPNGPVEVRPGIRTTTASIAIPGDPNNRRYFPHIDNNKRFQNNRVERSRQILQRVDPNDPTSAIIYNYTAIEFDLDVPQAAGLLAGEGISYAGDSGGPYFYNSLTTQFVGAMARPDGVWPDGTARPVPDWAAGDMQLLDDVLFAVHTFGNTIPGGGGNVAPNGSTFFNPVWTSFGGGVPLTPARIAWIQDWCSRIPAPGTASLLGLCGLVCVRRRRISAA
ncbi:MAG: hypothetical protein IPM33_04705 [Phycisphaerales bacterium]|nr:hypothetical protein [Phycisphaerales bacterium]